MRARSARGSRRSSDAHGEAWLDFGSDLLAVHVLTEDGIIAGTNRTFNKLFGVERLELLGKHQAALNNHSVAANLRLLHEIREQVNRHGSWRGLLTNRHPQGVEFTSRAHIYPLRYSGVRRLVCFQQPLPATTPPSIPPAAAEE